MFECGLGVVILSNGLVELFVIDDFVDYIYDCLVVMFDVVDMCYVVVW